VHGQSRPLLKGIEMTNTHKPRFKIGQRFTLRRGHAVRDAEIMDIHTTFNAKGESVKLRYVVRYVFCGQPTWDHDVVDTTIARALHAEHGSVAEV